MNKNKIFTLLAVLLVVFSLPSAVLAAKSKGTIIVPVDETIDGNYFAAGEQVLVDGTINGDLIVAGGVVIVTGAVSGDIIAAGGQVRVLGPVQGDIRLMGGDVQVDSIIGKNVTILGGNVLLGLDSAIGASAVVLAGNLDAMGSIEQNLRAGVGSLKLSGVIKENAWLKVGEPNQFIVQPQAWVGNNLEYTSPTRAEVLSGATINGEVVHTGMKTINDQQKKKAAGVLGAVLAIGYITVKLFQLVSLWILGLVLLWAVPKYLLKVNKALQKDFWPSVGRGLVVSFILPICLFVIALTLVGIPVAVLVGALYAVALLCSIIHISFYLGEWVLRKLTKRRWKGVSPHWSMILGVLLFVLIVSIPLIGWLLKWILVSAGFGALLMTWKDDVKKLR